MSRPALAAALVLAALAGACSKSTPAPTDAGICWHAVPLKDGKIKFNKLAENQPNLETCAASLEAMRLRFRNLVGGQDEIMGAYQGNYLYLKREGVFTAQGLDRTPYLALVRTGDGRLAIPGAVAQ